MREPSKKATEEAKKAIEDLIAQRQATIAEALDAEPMMRDMLSSLDKWILATLVAANGGATLGLLTAAHDLGIDPRPAIAPFLIGIVCALLGAMMERNSAGELLDSHDAIKAEQRRWAQSLRDLDFDEAKKILESGNPPAKDHIQASEGFSTIAKYFYRASLLAFIAGAVVGGFLIR